MDKSKKGLTTHSKSMKRVIALLTAALLAVGMFAGCAKSTTGSTATPAPTSAGTDTNTPGTSDATPTAPEVSATPAPEPYSFTMFVPYGYITNSPDGWSTYNDLPAYQELEKRTGVTVEYFGGDHQTIQTLLAGNNYPEVMIFSDTGYNLAYPDGTEKGIQDGVILDISDLIEQYAPNYVKRVNESIYNPETLKTASDKTVGIYALKQEEDPVKWGYVMREDLLRQVIDASGNYVFRNADDSTKAPVTYDDWEIFLSYVKDNGLTSGAPLFIHNTASDIYGNQLQAGYGATYNYYQVGGELRYGLIEQDYWDYLDKVSDWWAKGFVDMDFASNETSKYPVPYNVNPILVTGGPDTKAQYAAFYSYAAQMTDIENLGKLSPDGDAYNLIAVAPPVKQAGDTVHLRLSDADIPGYYAVITDKCKNVPRVLEWFDYIYSDEGTDLLNFGVEGLSYELVDGKKQFTDVILNTEGYDPSAMKDLYTSGIDYNFTFYKVPTDSAYPTLDANKVEAEAAWSSNSDSAFVYPEAADAFISQEDTEKLTAEGTAAQMGIFMLFVNHIMHGYADATLPYPMSPDIMKAAFPQIEGWVAIKQKAYDDYISSLSE